ncbi:hypothetical protein ABPG72_017527 [Tetrahymena utriculariae]
MNFVKEISKYFKGSPQRNNKIIEIQTTIIKQQIEDTKTANKNQIQQNAQTSSQIQERIEDNSNKIPSRVLKLKIDIPTRQNSSYIMLDRFTLLRKSIQQYFIHNDQDSKLIQGIEFDNITALKQFLNPFFEITEALCKRDGCCITKILKLIQRIRSVYLKDNSSDKIFIIDLKKKLLEVFNEKINESIFDRKELNCYLITRFLNPRTKDLSFLTKEEKEKTMKLIEDQCKLFSQTNNQSKQNKKHEEQKITFDVFGLNVDDEQTQSHSIEYKQELQNYINYTIHKQIPTLEWWYINQSVFPSLSQIARKYTNIQITSVEAEQVFSNAGHIMNIERQSLKSEHANQLIFISFNSKFQDF